MPESISEERLRNTRAWAAARVGQLSGAEVIVGAIDELLERRTVTASGVMREALAKAVYSLRDSGTDDQRKWAIETILGDGSQAFDLLATIHGPRLAPNNKLTFRADGSWELEPEEPKR